MTQTASRTLALVGAGAMGAALARGVIESGFCPAGNVHAYDPDQDRLQDLIRQTGCQAASSLSGAMRKCEIALICVKPQVVPDALEGIAPEVGTGKLVISIAAGVRISDLQSHLPDGTAVIRVMPNTPAMVGAGAAALALGPGVTKEQNDLALGLFQSVGLAIVVDEKLMDAVTGLSGSGPAFVYTVIEAMADAGVSTGLPRDAALMLAAQTVLGAARMVIQTGRHPAALRDQVTSPGGTTIAGCAELERGGLRAAIINAVQAAARRSAELSK